MSIDIDYINERTIINYRPQNTQLSASEYVLANKQKNLNLTKSHGMGSGIYGLLKRTSAPTITIISTWKPATP